MLTLLLVPLAGLSGIRQSPSCQDPDFLELAAEVRPAGTTGSVCNVYCLTLQRLVSTMSGCVGLTRRSRQSMLMIDFSTTQIPPVSTSSA